MTRGEFSFLEKWYEEDKEWKKGIEHRLNVLEDRFIAMDAVEAEKQRREENSNTRMGVIGGIVGAVLTAVVQIILGGNNQ